MNKDLNPAALSLIGGILVVLAVVARLGYFFYTATQVAAVEVPATQYPTKVFSEFDANGVFAKTANLVAPGGGDVAPATPVPVTTGDIGKQDLGTLE